MGLRDQNDVPLPYQRVPTAAKPVERTRANQANYDTLKVVFDSLTKSMEKLDQWHAFDLSEQDGLDIKQQIKAHQIAESIIQPLWEAVRNAIEMVDKNYREQ